MFVKIFAVYKQKDVIGYCWGESLEKVQGLLPGYEIVQLETTPVEVLAQKLKDQNK